MYIINVLILLLNLLLDFFYLQKLRDNNMLVFHGNGKYSLTDKGLLQQIFRSYSMNDVDILNEIFD